MGHLLPNRFAQGTWALDLGFVLLMAVTKWVCHIFMHCSTESTRNSLILPQWERKQKEVAKGEGKKTKHGDKGERNSKKNEDQDLKKENCKAGIVWI